LDEVDKYGQTALMLASGRGNLQIVKLLLGAKANKKLVSKSKATAFDFANENGHNEIAKLLRG
jgi:ankyrin repeat protein